MLIALLHRRPRLVWPLLALSTLLLAAGVFVLVWPA